MMRGKRGSGHLEMIIAFVLFVLFVLFLFLIIKPYKTEGIGNSILDTLEDSFERETEVDLIRVSLKVSNNEAECFKVDISEIVSVGNSIVRDHNQEIVSSDFNVGQLEVIRKKGFFYTYVSGSLDDGDETCNYLVEDFDVGGVVEKKILSDISIIQIEGDYNSNYELLRTRLNLPSSVDFAIVDLHDGAYSLERNIPAGINVLSKSYVREVLFSNGTIETKEFILKVW
jgi:hypothetical protein